MIELSSIIGGARLFHRSPLSLIVDMYCVDSDWNIQRIVYLTRGSGWDIHLLAGTPHFESSQRIPQWFVMDRTPCNMYPSLNRPECPLLVGTVQVVLGIDGEPNMSQACSPFRQSMRLSL